MDGCCVLRSYSLPHVIRKFLLKLLIDSMDLSVIIGLGSEIALNFKKMWLITVNSWFKKEGDDFLL